VDRKEHVVGGYVAVGAAMMVLVQVLDRMVEEKSAIVERVRSEAKQIVQLVCGMGQGARK